MPDLLAKGIKAMPRAPRTALTPEAVIIGRQRPKVRVQIRAEYTTGHAGGNRHEVLPSIVVHDIPLDTVYQTVVEALRQLAERTQGGVT